MASRLFAATLRSGGIARRNAAIQVRYVSTQLSSPRLKTRRNVPNCMSSGPPFPNTPPSNSYYIRHSLFTHALPTFLVPPVVLLGLVIALWFYKCCMMIIFQNKIIYMPSIPPFSRRERIADYAAACKPVHWEEKRIKSLDGTQIALCVGEIKGTDGHESQKEKATSKERTVVLYFQGNASSLPPRLPALSNVLKSLEHVTNSNQNSSRLTLVALSYRGFWTSRGRPSQRGIELDAKATMSWMQNTYRIGNNQVKLILWGQSIGSGVATGAAAEHLRLSSRKRESYLDINGLILETPFVSISKMLTALYPQKWLPYRYLSPFLRNWWDSEAALRSIAESGAGRAMPILIISAGKDEVVPPDQGDYLEQLCKSLRLPVTRTNVPGALHTESMSKREGRVAVADFVRMIALR